MSELNLTPSGERVHIGFFGVRNAGKSSVVNAVTGQDLAVVSETLGTTTDPVRKAMELLPLGPVVIVDTPGIDDTGDLGALRVKKARQALRRCDIAVLVVDAKRGIEEADEALLEAFEQRDVPCVVAWNKADLLDEAERESVRSAIHPACNERGLLVSARTGEGIHELKELIGRVSEGRGPAKRLVADLIDEGDLVVLVIPIDESAPKGRIILPQQMVLRDCLDVHASCLACQPEELSGVLAALAHPPRLVITDSQVFGRVAGEVPRNVPLTSFSILMARYKGSLAPFVRGAAAIDVLRDGDRVLVAEGCSHHRQCEDIGTVKIPAWIRGRTGANPEFSFTSGGEFPEDVGDYRLVIHCGACMLNDKEMGFRMRAAAESGVPIVNYGMAIAQMHGILDRALEVFREDGGGELGAPVS